MRVVHISGSPGSGKTTLGRQLASPPAVVVKDTDEFFDGAPKTIWETAAAWLAYVDQSVQEFKRGQARNATVVVFVGILDGWWGGKHVFYEFKDADALFVLDVPVAHLLRQFYGRYAKLSAPDFWEDVARSREKIPSSEEKMREHAEDVREHVARGYQHMTRTAIAARVMQMSACRACKTRLAAYVCTGCGERYCGSACHAHDEIRFTRKGIADWSLADHLDPREIARKIPREVAARIFAAACKESAAFTTDEKRAPFGDVGIDLYVMGALSAERKSVPELDRLFQAALPQPPARAFHPIRARVGEAFTFRYSTSATNWPTVVLSDGLVLEEDVVMEDDEKPGGSIVHQMSIIPRRRRGLETITVRTRHPNGPETTAVTDVLVE